MQARTISRRLLLGSSAAVLGAGVVVPMTANAQMAFLTPDLLSGIASPGSLLAALLTDLQAALAAGGGLAHGNSARRVPVPAFLKLPNNPHFIPQGSAFTPAEQQAYRPSAASGRGV